MISALVIAYNQEKYIEDCLKGILNQTYKDQEIIISDDCSTDGTWEIIKSYEDRLWKAFPLVRIFRQPKNLGLKGRNNIKFVSSLVGDTDFVQICDGDDYYKPEKSEVQLNWFKEQSKKSEDHHFIKPEYGFVYSNWDLIENGNFIANGQHARGLATPVGNIRGHFKNGNFIMTCTIMVRTEIFKRAFDFQKFTDLGILTGDYACFAQASKLTKFGYINESLAVYNSYRNSTISKPETRHLYEEDFNRVREYIINETI